MSRIGKLPISIPAGVTVAQDKDGVVTVKGPKGELSQKVDRSIDMKIEDGHITFEINEESPVNIKQKQAFHGLYRALINNMVVGVSEGYKKELELVGVGYRVSNQGNIIEFSLGYTHPIFIQLPKEVKVETKMERNQNPQIILESCDKQLLVARLQNNLRVLVTFCLGLYFHFLRKLDENRVRVAERQLDDVALVRDTVADTDQLHLLLVAFAHADNHVVDQRTIQTVEGLLLLLADGTFLVNLKCDVTVFHVHLDGTVNLLREFSFRTFHDDHAVLVLVHGNACRNANWQFSYS